MPRVLVTGASGFVGRCLVERLVSTGRAVVALSRSKARVPAGAVPLVGNLGTGEGLGDIDWVAIDTVFHCAGEIRQVDQMREVHVNGTKRLLERVRPAVRWIQLSSVGAYGPSATGKERVVDELAPEQPSGTYEVTKTEADNLVRNAASSGGCDYSVLRPSAIVGEQMSNQSLRSLITMVRRRWYVHIGPTNAMANYVHVDDVVSALLLCEQERAAIGETFNLSSDCPWVDVIAQMATLSGIPAPTWRVSERTARAVASLSQLVGGPLSLSRVAALGGRTLYPSDKIESRLGFRFSRPMPGALDELVAAMGRVE